MPSGFTYERPAFSPQPRKRPTDLVKRERKGDEEKYYRQQKALAKKRDGKRCRICGAGDYVESHHVARRSSFGSREVLAKHHHSNLLTVCAGPRRNGVVSCHDLLTKNVMKAVSTTDRGTNGAVFVTRWSDPHQDFITYRKAA